MMKMRILAAVGAFAMLSLSACSGENAVDKTPAAGSPDLEAVETILADLPLGSTPLQPFNADATVQLRQQMDLMGSEVRNTANPNHIEIQPTSRGCKAMLSESFALENLHWPSIAAMSRDEKAAVQVFLAPEAAAVAKTMNQMRNLASQCPEATVSSSTGKVRVVTTVNAPDSAVCPWGYRQSVTRDGVSQTLDVCQLGYRNTLLSVAIADSSDSSAATDRVMDDFAQSFFARLKPLYDNQS